jgi:1-deoxy-D-xylulose-5-phosphate reductoisomerase
MGYPDRVPFGGERLSLAKLGTLTFEEPDTERFPCLKMAYEAQKLGGVMPVALNGGNEAAVAAFLAGKIPFGAIADINARVLEHTVYAPIVCAEDVYEADRAARALAQRVIERL